MAAEWAYSTYIAHIGIMMRAYTIVFAYCQVRVYRYFFCRENSTQYPTPPMSPEHPLSTRPKFSVMQSTRNTIVVVESVILLD